MWPFGALQPPKIMFNPCADAKNSFLLVFPLQNSLSMYPKSLHFCLNNSGDGHMTTKLKKWNFIEIGNAYSKILCFDFVVRIFIFLVRWLIGSFKNVGNYKFWYTWFFQHSLKTLSAALVTTKSSAALKTWKIRLDISGISRVTGRTQTCFKYMFFSMPHKLVKKETITFSPKIAHSI